MLRHLKTLKDMATSVGPPFYPETTGKVLLVNAPRVAAVIFNILRPVLPKVPHAALPAVPTVLVHC